MMPRSTTPSQPTSPSRRSARRAAALARNDVDLRGLLDPRLLSQGPRPLCVPFTLALGNEASRTIAGAAPEALAPEPIWRYCTQRGQTGAAGMLINDAAAALADDGQPSLQAWPYNDALGVGTEDPPHTAGNPPWLIAAVHELHLAHDGIEDELEDYLVAAVPVVLIVEVTQEFTHPDNEGYVRLPNLRTAAGDYHAVTCVGAATNPARGRHLLIRNSWGPYWGSGGYCWLPTEYLIAFVPYAAIVLPSTSPPATT
jgi:hypothetical protein